ncbi:ethanolamine utilization protein EutH [Alteribacter natronophilus]|uniref:ethanolamine utilization protein EutH n=1 Tax=Alteribacter natronophilus TaxID=2583810 RepID=UPI00110DD926|nr:ethanolamine utilization protein EutH [Alteribacter natronophilus]TMW70427.1 ethanolamine utilization protein EutH [Alteribacter natronophilus]
MWLNEIVLWTIAVFAAIGALDRVAGNRFGYGGAFERAFQAMGPLALAMIGAICFSPVAAEGLRPVLTPVFEWAGADPAMFAGILFAIDMGGYPLAVELAGSQEAALFSGIILATVIGPLFVFTIPVALGIIEKADQPFFARGVLTGLVTVPLGAWIGGTAAGFEASFLLKNLMPLLAAVVPVIAGLIFAPLLMVKGFLVFGRIVTALLTVLAGIIAVEAVTGTVVVQGTAPVEDALVIVGMIALTLAGAFPFVHFLQKVLASALKPVSRVTGVNTAGLTGLLASLAHSIPAFQTMGDMNPRGKVMSGAFAVSGAFVLGGHLGFTASLEPEMIVPMMTGKLSAGVIAVGIVMLWPLSDKAETELKRPGENNSFSRET